MIRGIVSLDELLERQYVREREEETGGGADDSGVDQEYVSFLLNEVPEEDRLLRDLVSVFGSV